MRLFCFGLFLVSIFNQVLIGQKPVGFDPVRSIAAKAEARTLVAPPLVLDGRSDTLDILKTELNFSVYYPDFINAIASLYLVPKVNGAAKIRLDLEGLTVDSVKLNGISSTFNQSGASLLIDFPITVVVGNTYVLTISYQGKPVQDITGWGGWYHQEPYVFNLGVGFGADPHSFGRAWFPCFDNFVERSTFDFFVITAPDKAVWCNGYLVLDNILPTGIRTREWRIDQPIPSYLACFAAGPYVPWKRTLAGELGPVPVEIAAAAADTGKVAGTFQHLPQALAAFEHWYGPFRWNKIGYSLVPFNSGAMEHATNIAIGKDYIDGSLTYETLWAHELSHHWWGDLATCSTAEDMWLNEGWASYSEHLFTEWLYGHDAYIQAVRSNFLPVLENAHVNEGGYRAVSGVPHEITYGDHVYHKGASVAHNLRTYLGDSLFRQGLRSALDQTQFDDWSSAELRDKLESATGVDLHPFFEDWVFSGGFPHFSVDSVKMIFSPIDAPTKVRVYVKQKLRGAPHFYHQVPLDFTFVFSDWQRETRRAMVDGEASIAEFEFPAFGPIPQWIWLNTDWQLTLARADNEQTIKTSGNKSFGSAKMTLDVTAVPDSALVRVEHHYVMPDTAGANPQGYRLTNRYWTIAGDLPNGFEATGRVFYDGRGQLDQLDTELFTQTSDNEDSVLLLYRPGPGMPWAEYPGYSKNTIGNANNAYGFLQFEHAKVGQYTIAKGAASVGTQEQQPAVFGVEIIPNPARRSIQVKTEKGFDSAVLLSAEGDAQQSWSFKGARTATLNVGALPRGIYWLVLSGKNGSTSTKVVLH